MRERIVVDDACQCRVVDCVNHMMWNRDHHGVIIPQIHTVGINSIARNWNVNDCVVVDHIYLFSWGHIV